MDKQLDTYLEKVDRYLKPLPIGERADIIREIKSTMVEMRRDGKTAEEIQERLGEPKYLAKAYLGDLIAQRHGIIGKQILAICAFYSLAGFSGIVVIPVLGICGPTFMASGALVVVAGVFKTLAMLLHLNLHNLISFNVGIAAIEQNPFMVFGLMMLLGIGLFLAGYACWKGLIYYIKAMTRIKAVLSV